jgi:short-subunit dehydrogenase
LDQVATELRNETGREITVLPADLASGDGLGAVENVLASNTNITLFVNNAGSTMKGGILENDAAAFTSLIALNVTAVTVLASAAAKAFKARGNGKIVNVSSSLALAPDLFNGGEGTYSATKAFLFHLSQSLNAQLADSGVHVQAVLPGATRTEIWSKAAIPVEALPKEMVMEAGDLVDAALKGLDRGETVTIPSLAEEALWSNYEEARIALLPNISADRPSPRYR